MVKWQPSGERVPESDLTCRSHDGAQRRSSGLRATTGAFRVTYGAVGWPRIDNRRSPKGTGKREERCAARRDAVTLTVFEAGGQEAGELARYDR